MSKVVRGVKKGVKKVGKAVSRNWKPIVGAGLAAFTGGLAVGGLGAFQSAVATKGLWSTVGSTMWAGVTGTAGTLGIGSGASGTFAAGAGMQGATLMTGAGAQALGLAAQTVGPPTSAAGLSSAGVGTYTGPGSSFMGGGGSLFGGGAATRGGQMVPNAVGPSGSGGAGPGGSAPARGGMGLLGNMATAAVPALINAGGAYMMAKGEEEDLKQDVWGVSHKNPQNAYTQNFANPYAGYFDPDGNSMGLMDMPGHVRYTGGWT